MYIYIYTYIYCIYIHTHTRLTTAFTKDFLHLNVLTEKSSVQVRGYPGRPGLNRQTVSRWLNRLASEHDACQQKDTQSFWVVNVKETIKAETTASITYQSGDKTSWYVARAILMIWCWEKLLTQTLKLEMIVTTASELYDMSQGLNLDK